jgi:TldD protein
MKVAASPFLKAHKPVLQKLVELLSRQFVYVSVLGTDLSGKQYQVRKTGVSINDSMWAERGFVVRVYNGINYSEFSFNELEACGVDALAEKIRSDVQAGLNLAKDRNIAIIQLPHVEEEPANDRYLGEVLLLPETQTAGQKLQRLISIQEKALNGSASLVDFRVVYEEVKVAKLFISGKRELEQSYIWSQGYLWAVVGRNGKLKYCHQGFSGNKALELLDEMECGIGAVVDTAVGLLDAQAVEPGEYDVICSPDVAGLIAHEAFGHGVEMDMFVKERAKALEYMQKPVASSLVVMHDGAAAARQVATFLFDDEGVCGKDTVIIQDGILKTGICDLLTARHLNTVPTGNGRRESFERKAYTRMTNTFFAPGKDTLEDMMATIRHGFLLCHSMSGMEDPKSWGIQCMVLEGKEIVDGKLTGKVVSPLIVTGYVPDLLKSISMVSGKVELYGSGACGKGYKEFVKVSCGGPYIKAKVRLG